MPAAAADGRSDHFFCTSEITSKTKRRKPKKNHTGVSGGGQEQFLILRQWARAQKERVYVCQLQNISFENCFDLNLVLVFVRVCVCVSGVELHCGLVVVVYVCDGGGGASLFELSFCV